MRSIILLFGFCMTFSISTAQVLNGSFEEWDTSAMKEAPFHWEINQFDRLVRAERDTTISVDGKSSVKLFPDPYPWKCESKVKQVIEMDSLYEEDISLYFYARTISDNQEGTIHFEVEIFVFDDTHPDYKLFRFDEEIKDFRKFEFPLVSGDVDSISIEFKGGSACGPADGAVGQSYTWIDNVHIAEQGRTNSKLNISSPINIYPNPSKGKVYFQGLETKNATYMLYDIHAQPISSGPLTDKSIFHPQKGIYFVVIKLPSGHRSVHKIIIQ